MNLWPLHPVALIFYVTREIWSSSDGWAHFSLSSDYPLRVLQDIMLGRFTRFLAKCKSFMLLWLLAWKASRRRDVLILFAPFNTYQWDVQIVWFYKQAYYFYFNAKTWTYETEYKQYIYIHCRGTIAFMECADLSTWHQILLMILKSQYCMIWRVIS